MAHEQRASAGPSASAALTTAGLQNEAQGRTSNGKKPVPILKKTVSFPEHIANAAAEAMTRGNRTREEHDNSSADETTAILAAGDAGGTRDYSTTKTRSTGAEQEASGSNTRRRRQSQQSTATSQEAKEQESWWRRTVEKYGTVELENKGSVARDHLALERTFLAWLRTSLSFASIGIAITQLFRLNTSIEGGDSTREDADKRLRQVGKPLGATFIGISIVILFIGFHRYFESQHYVIRGKFPASRGSILVVATVAGALIVVSLIVVLIIGKGAFES